MNLEVAIVGLWPPAGGGSTAASAVGAAVANVRTRPEVPRLNNYFSLGHCETSEVEHDVLLKTVGVRAQLRHSDA